MRRALGWMCYRTVMMWPGAWPSGAVAGWILAWAGDYANETPNVKVSGPEAASSPEGRAQLPGWPAGGKGEDK